MSRFTAGLLKTAMKTVYEYEKEILQNYTNQLESGNIVDYVVSLEGDSLIQHSERPASHLHQSDQIAAQKTPSVTAKNP